MKASLFSGEQQSAMSGQFAYPTQWGKIQNIYKTLSTAPFLDLEDQKTPQTDPLFPPLHQIF